MKIKVIAYGIARDFLGRGEFEMEQENIQSVGDVRAWLCEQYPDFNRLQSLRFAVNEAYEDDNFILTERDEVVIIPPVSGG